MLRAGRHMTRRHTPPDFPARVITMRRSVSIPVTGGGPPALDRASIHQHHRAQTSHLRSASLERHSVSTLLSGNYLPRLSLADPVTQSFK